MSNILFIEPDTVLTRIYARALERYGHVVVCASDAQQALDLADDNRPDVVILEPLLARYSGIGFLHEFRSYPEWRRVPVILHTRLSMETLVGMQQALQDDLGITAILYKPKTTLTQLLRTVAENGRLS